jgi:hypothetical protein
MLVVMLGGCKDESNAGDAAAQEVAGEEAGASTQSADERDEIGSSASAADETSGETTSSAADGDPPDAGNTRSTETATDESAGIDDTATNATTADGGELPASQPRDAAAPHSGDPGDGGSDSGVLGRDSRDDASAPPDGRVPIRVDGVILIDDGEDGDNRTADGPFAGFWYTDDQRTQCVDDEMPRGDVNPVPESRGGPIFTMTSYEDEGVSPPPTETGDDNRYAMRFWGGDEYVYAAAMAVTLNEAEGAAEPIDLQAMGIDGLRFWARAAEVTTVSVGLSDPSSEPVGGLCVPQEYPECDPEGCYDHPATRINVDEQWRLFELPLAYFRREGWGTYVEGATVPFNLDPTAVYRLSFTNLLDAPFDLWIDDVAFTLQYARGPECALPPVTSITCNVLEPGDARLDDLCFEPSTWEGQWEPPPDADASEACPPPEIVLPSRPTRIGYDCIDIPVEICDGAGVEQSNGECCYRGIMQEVAVCCE